MESIKEGVIKKKEQSCVFGALISSDTKFMTLLFFLGGSCPKTSLFTRYTVRYNSKSLPGKKKAGFLWLPSVRF